MKLRAVIVAVVVAVVGAAYFVFFASGDRNSSGVDGIVNDGSSIAVDNSIGGNYPKATTSDSHSSEVGKRGRRFRPRVRSGAEWTLDDFDDSDHPYSKEDKQAALALQLALDALDEFDEEDVIKAERSWIRNKHAAKPAALLAKERFFATAARAATSSNPAVRKEAINAYSWRGGESLPELTPMMADQDDEVAQEAIDAVQSALEEQANADLRFDAAVAYMRTFSSNEEVLDMLSTTVATTASELIDDAANAEIASDMRVKVVQAVVDMIASPKKELSEVGRNLYEEITGNEWLNIEEAEIYLSDPDNYELPDEL